MSLDALAIWEAERDAAAGGVEIEGVEVDRAWLTTAAAVVELRLAPREDWTREGPPDALAQVLRIVADACAQVAWPVPVIGVVVSPDDGHHAARAAAVAAWNADQDWHRGDFVLEIAAEADRSGTIARIAGPLDTKGLRVEPMSGPIEVAEYARRLRERAQAAASAEAAGLLRAIAGDLEDGRLGPGIDAWAEAVIDAAARARRRAERSRARPPETVGEEEP